MSDPDGENVVVDAPLPGGSQTAERGFRDALMAVVDRLPLAAAVFGMVVAGAAAYLWTRTPRYTATSRLLIERTGVDLTAMRDALDPTRSGLAARDLLDTHAQLLTSRPVLEAALVRGGLDGAEDIVQAPDPAGRLAEILRVAPARTGFVLEVSAERENPEEAARLVNAVVGAYLDSVRARRLGVSDQGIRELRAKADELRESLDAATATLHRFMEEHRVVSADEADSLARERLRALGRAVHEAEPRLVRAEARLAAAEAIRAEGRPVETLPDIQESRVIAGLRLDLARLEQQHAELQARLGAMHPQLQGLALQMDAIRARLAEESDHVVGALREKAREIRAEVEALRQEIAVQEEEVLRQHALADRYRILAEERDAVQEAYAAVMRRIAELDVGRLSGHGEQVFVVAPAETPRAPSWPRRGRMLLLAALFGLVGGASLCVGLDALNPTVRNEEDVERLTGAGLVTLVPRAARRRGRPADDLAAWRDPRSPFAEAFRTARSALAFTGPEGAPASLVVTSALPGEGKSLVAVNLAIAFAAAGQRVLLVDADLRKPRLHRTFSESPPEGLAGCLADGGDPDRVEKAIATTEVDGLSFLPAGTPPPNPVERLDSPAFARMADVLASRFDRVVFDAPPVAHRTDALVAARHTAGLLLVVRAFSTPGAVIRSVTTHLRRARIPILGAVLNYVDEPRGHAYAAHYAYGAYGYAAESEPASMPEAARAP